MIAPIDTYEKSNIRISPTLRPILENIGIIMGVITITFIFYIIGALAFAAGFHLFHKFGSMSLDTVVFISAWFGGPLTIIIGWILLFKSEILEWCDS